MKVEMEESPKAKLKYGKNLLGDGQVIARVGTLRVGVLSLRLLQSGRRQNSSTRRVRWRLTVDMGGEVR
jgi:hypothetical protein